MQELIIYTGTAQSRCFQLLTFYFPIHRILLQKTLPFPAFPISMVPNMNRGRTRSRSIVLSAVISTTRRSSVGCCNLHPSIWPISITISNTDPQTHLAPRLMALAPGPAEHLAFLHRVEMWVIADGLYWIEHTHAAPLSLCTVSHLLTNTH